MSDAPVQPVGDDSVWAHTNGRLYRVDPITLGVTDVGAIKFPMPPNQLTDLAVDRSGGMVGISTRELYRIDKTTARATKIADLADPYNGLSYASDGNGGETLLAGTQDGNLFRLDPTSGAVTLVGSLGDGLTMSGDLVFIYGVGVLATVTKPGWTTDRLASIDAITGRATVIGDTGYDNVYGIGYWGGRVFGFTESGAFIIIDVATGAASPAHITQFAWWGAAVTTTAPVIL